MVKFDPSIASITPVGGLSFGGSEGCNEEDSSLCTCEANRACLELRDYVEVPYFLRQTLNAYRLGSPSMRGLY